MNTREREKPAMFAATEAKATCFARIPTPIGKLLLVGERDGDGLALRGVYFDAAPHAAGAVPAGAREDEPAFVEVCAQLAAYFAGERQTFDLALAPVGTQFQRRVWSALAEIPYGETTTYAAIARSIGKPSAVRAVGAANARNPLSIVVPCHRVIGRDGALTGYAGGLPSKRLLLDLEAARARGAKNAQPSLPR
jgi:methylated-DNA-[protein]-cysteine S-methyltransferase